MIPIAFVSVRNHYHINTLGLLLDPLYMYEEDLALNNQK